ncbi:DUF4158 domain-containing protein [Streptomycetaceae bacterium NBC_01309]
MPPVLDAFDRALIGKRRGGRNRLGFALQMCTVPVWYVGLFLEDPLAVPWPVVEHLAASLGHDGDHGESHGEPRLVRRTPRCRAAAAVCPAGFRCR